MHDARVSESKGRSSIKPLLPRDARDPCSAGIPFDAPAAGLAAVLEYAQLDPPAPGSVPTKDAIVGQLVRFAFHAAPPSNTDQGLLLVQDWLAREIGPQHVRDVLLCHCLRSAHVSAAVAGAACAMILLRLRDVPSEERTALDLYAREGGRIPSILIRRRGNGSWSTPPLVRHADEVRRTLGEGVVWRIADFEIARVLVGVDLSDQIPARLAHLVRAVAEVTGEQRFWPLTEPLRMLLLATWARDATEQPWSILGELSGLSADPGSRTAASSAAPPAPATQPMSRERLPLVQLEIMGTQERTRHVIGINGCKCPVGSGLFEVIKLLAYQHEARPGEPAELPLGKEARKRFLTRLSDLRRIGKLPTELREILRALPKPLIDPQEVRFNPDLTVIVTVP